MRISKILLIVTTTGLLSCGQSSKSKQEIIQVENEKTESTENIISRKASTYQNEIYIDTVYEYPDSIERRLVIENSLPKGGLKYTDPAGKDFVYAIFWTRISNKTGFPLEFTINFPADSFKIPSSSYTYFKLLIPPDTMTIEKESMFNYGLSNLEPTLDKIINKQSSLQLTINPKGSYSFYVISLFNKGVEGVVRAGFSKIGQNLFYRINGKEIQCGQVLFKN